MKRILAIISVIFVMVSATGCGNRGTPVVRVVTSSVGDGSESYETVYEDGKVKKTDNFTPEADTVYQTDEGDYSSDVKDGKFTVKLNNTKLTDEDGNEAAADENMVKLMQWIADNSEHDVLAVYLVTLQDKYFAMVELNVNWQDPCILYMYDSEKQQFYELHQWDNVKLEGVSLPDSSN